jgi:hypothetical protein
MRSYPPDRLGERDALTGIDLGETSYYCMTMVRPRRESTVLTIRVDTALKRSLAREARRRHTTKSELVRELLAASFEDRRGGSSIQEEARRQSILVSRRESERDTLDFIEHAADTRGWE